MLGENSQAIIHNRLQALAREFVELHQADRQLPWNKRKSVGMLMATREWDFSILSPYVKNKGDK
jgi:hypothetical protein